MFLSNPSGAIRQYGQNSGRTSYNSTIASAFVALPQIIADTLTSKRKYIPFQSLISLVDLDILTGTSLITKSREHMKMLGSIVYPAGEGDLFIGTSGGSSCRGALIISMILNKDLQLAIQM